MSKSVKCINNENIEEFLEVGKYYRLVNIFRSEYIEVLDKNGESIITAKERFELPSPEKKFHSSHYESDTIEPIELISSNKLDFCRASIIKYAFRAGDKKGQEVLDIKKIIDYAILLAMQENINFTKDDAQSIIDYRFEWKEKRGGVNNASN